MLVLVADTKDDLSTFRILAGTLTLGQGKREACSLRPGLGHPINDALGETGIMVALST
jgi:hypothetical protein